MKYKREIIDFIRLNKRLSEMRMLKCKLVFKIKILKEENFIGSYFDINCYFLVK